MACQAVTGGVCCAASVAGATSSLASDLASAGVVDVDVDGVGSESWALSVGSVDFSFSSMGAAFGDAGASVDGEVEAIFASE